MTERKVHRGDLVITEAGTIVRDTDIYGAVFVKAPNVTLMNCTIYLQQNTEAGFSIDWALAGGSLSISGCDVKMPPAFDIYAPLGFKMHGLDLEFE